VWQDRVRSESRTGVGKIGRILRSSRLMKSDGKEEPANLRLPRKTRHGEHDEERQ
jgi:hypothetical protein